MNNEERLNLKKMLAQNQDYVDHTEDIRRLKHSGLLLDSMRDIEKLKRANQEMRQNEPDKFIELCKTEAPLMYNLYMDLFHKLVIILTYKNYSLHHYLFLKKILFFLMLYLF